MTMDPSVIGWTEFWLRLGLGLFLVVTVMFVVTVTVKLVMLPVRAVRWVLRGRKGRRRA